MSEAADLPPQAPRRGRTNPIARGLLRLVLMLVVPLAAILVGAHFYMLGGRFIETENAYLKSHIIAVSSDVDGRVVRVAVRDNSRVTAGDLLFEIDPEPFDLAVRQAEAKMAVVSTEIESLRADYREALVAIADAREQVEFANRQYERQQRMRERKLGSEEAYDQARHDHATAKQRLEVLRERSRRVLAALGGTADLPVEQHPRYVEARSIRDQAAVQLARTRVKAASSGVISNMRLQAGEYVEEGEPVFSLIEMDLMWVEANLKETQLTYVHEGQHAEIEVDAYPGRRWAARVYTIAPATGAEFALLPPQNATGNWVKVVQRVPVNLHLEPDPDSPPLRAGMTVSVRIDTERQRELPALARRLLEGESMPEFLRGLLRQAIAMNQPAGTS